MLSGLSSYLFGGPTEEDHPAASTQSAAELAAAARDRSPHLRTLSTDDDDWTIVDKASRGNSPLRLDDNPMENLLIEHPSMSVYQQRGRPNSRGTDSDDSESESEEANMDMAPPQQPPRQVNTRPQSRHARLAAAGVLSSSAVVKAKKSAQVAQKRKEQRKVGRTQLERSNKVQKYNSASKIPRRKQHMFQRNSGRNNDRKCHF